LPETIVTVLDSINRLLSSLVNRHIPAVYEAEQEGRRKEILAFERYRLIIYSRAKCLIYVYKELQRMVLPPPECR